MSSFEISSRQKTTSNTQGVRASFYFMDIMIFLTMIIIVFTSFMISAFFQDGSWFQRSGSLIVLGSAYLQYRFRKHSLNKLYTNPLPFYLPHLGMIGFFRKCHWKIGKMSLTLLAAGTFIWGYGDLIF